MPVQIVRVSVRNQGPINDLQLDLGPFNLIYGKNERGKTFLVEFIIRSLFKYATKWNLRKITGSGKVEVTGLNDSVISFSPSTKDKIEDFLTKSKETMPSTISKLLVVKGAELDLVDNIPGGINRSIVREYLSSETILDAIQKRISKTLKSAKIEDHSIDGRHQGEIKKMRELEGDLKDIDELFEEISNVYSEGYRISLQNQLDDLIDAINNQEEAKRFLAQQLSSDIADLKNNQGDLSRESINELRQLNLKYMGVSENIAEKEKESDELQQECEYYEWLRNAIEEYKERVSGVGIKWKFIFAILAGVALIISIAIMLTILSGWINPTTGYILVISSIVFAGFMGGSYIKQQNTMLRRSFDLFEEQQLSNEFEDLFGEPLNSLASMETLLEKLQSKHYRRQNLKEDLSEENLKLEVTKSELLQNFILYGIEIKKDDSWDDVIKDMDSHVQKTEEFIHQKEVQLGSLNVKEDDYVYKSPDIEYNSDKLDELIEAKDQTKENLDEANKNLDTLKQRIWFYTGDDISIGWEALLGNLLLRRQEFATEYKNAAARVIGSIILNNEIETIREQQDEQIKEILCSDVITHPLFNLTKKYEKLEMHDDILYVSDPYGSYPVSDISTGAQEQVLLAIRLGCALRITGRDSLFVILDDAFQHADWDRREWLVDEIIDMAKADWQIIYLTMDDHIRDLIRQKGLKAFGEEMVYINLEENTN